MDELFRQIAWAANNGLYFLALAGSLVIPDICGALESSAGVASGAAYASWFDAQLGPIYSGYLDGDTCYKFRCSFLHQGTTQHPKGPYTRVMFMEPGGPVIHLSIIIDALAIDVRLFTLDVVQAAIAWQQAQVGTEPFDTNVRKFVTRYPSGLMPYVVGAPLIS